LKSWLGKSTTVPSLALGGDEKDAVKRNMKRFVVKRKSFCSVGHLQ